MMSGISGPARWSPWVIRQGGVSVSSGCERLCRRQDQENGCNPRTMYHADISAEVEGERDAVVEENTPETPAPEGVEADDVAAAVTEPAEPEEIQKGLDEYLAERASAAFEFGKKEGRRVNAETLEGSEFRRQGIDDFFTGKVSFHRISSRVLYTCNAKC